MYIWSPDHRVHLVDFRGLFGTNPMYLMQEIEYILIVLAVTNTNDHQ
jgi:hypothetical protein